MGLKAELEKSLGIAPKIRWGGLGQLDVLVDGTVVFSKQRAGRMPNPGEVARLIKSPRA